MTLPTGGRNGHLINALSAVLHPENMLFKGFGSANSEPSPQVILSYV
jgi:hypothetical protein